MIWTYPWPVWLSQLEHCPLHQKVLGSVPGQVTYPDCGFDTQLLVNVFLSHQCSFCSSSLSKTYENTFLGEDKKIRVLVKSYSLTDFLVDFFTYLNSITEIWSHDCKFVPPLNSVKFCFMCFEIVLVAHAFVIMSSLWTDLLLWSILFMLCNILCSGVYFV